MSELLIPGLESPGPIYVLPGGFVKAATKTKHPTWGTHEALSLKSGRYRTDEVRFTSNRHMREMYGHFSPGPQYALPGTIGGTTGNYNAAAERVQQLSVPARGPDLANAAMPYASTISGTAGSAPPTAKLSATQLGGTMNYTMTHGSFSDPNRTGSGVALEGNTEYWRSATMLQVAEPNYQNAAPNPVQRQPWHLTQARAHDTRARHR